jgi:hypothetical protein
MGPEGLCAQTLGPVRKSVLVVGLEAIPHPGLGQKVSRATRVALELAAQLRHVHAEVPGRGFVARTPNLGQQALLA